MYNENMDEKMKELIIKAQEIIDEADAILITAGAGMGVDSGLPDFRGNHGFWNAYPEAKKRGLSFSQMANPEWFKRDPELAWAFYGHRLNLYRETIPHEGFKLLLELGKSKKGGYFVFTSNVDGQFQKAGFDEDCIEEVHGSIHHLQCIDDCQKSIWSANGASVDVDMDTFKAKNFPHCPHCDSVARPNILMFGDWDWKERRTHQQKIKLRAWLNGLSKNNYKLAVIEIGAGEAIPTVRMKSEDSAKYDNGRLIRINPRDFHVPDYFKGVGLSVGGLEGIQHILGQK